MVDIAYRGFGIASKFVLLLTRRRGSGRRGWPKHVELDKGCTPVVSAVDSTRFSLQVAVSVMFSLQDDLLANWIETGVLVVDSKFKGGVNDISYRGVEHSAGSFWSLQPCRGVPEDGDGQNA